jgi:hypothetical protein
VRSVTDESVMGETTLGVHGRADVGSDSGESCPIGLVLHRREEKRRDEAGGDNLSNGMLSFVLPVL